MGRAAWDERYEELEKKQFKYAEQQQKIVDATAKTGGGGPDMGTPEQCTGDCEKISKLMEALKGDDQCSDPEKGSGVERPDACKDEPSGALGGLGAMAGGASLMSVGLSHEFFLIPAQPFDRRQVGTQPGLRPTWGTQSDQSRWPRRCPLPTCAKDSLRANF